MRDDSSTTTRLYRLLDQLGPLVAMLAVWALFAALQWKTFATWENTQSILLQTAVVGIAALGATMIIISGGIDLSVGSLIALVSVVGGAGAQRRSRGRRRGGLGPPTSAAQLRRRRRDSRWRRCAGWRSARWSSAGWAASWRCVAVGLGGLIAWSYGYGTARGVDGCWPSASSSLAAAWWVDRRLKPPIVLIAVHRDARHVGRPSRHRQGAGRQLRRSTRRRRGSTHFMQLPQAKVDASLIWRPWQWWSPGVWIFLVLAVLVAALLRYTQFGRHIYAIGSNEQTARLCGVHVERTKLKIYTLARPAGRRRRRAAVQLQHHRRPHDRRRATS